MTNTNTITIAPRGPLVGSIRPPGSKSITNRALVCAALADGPSRLEGVLDSEDTQVMLRALQQVGLRLTHDVAGQAVEVIGSGGRLPVTEADVDVVNSGTTIRFLTAMLAGCGGRYRLDGNQRMRQRPIADLLEALGQLGATAHSENANGCPPVVVSCPGIPGGRAALRGDVSSQYLSGLLLAAPLADSDVQLEIVGPLVSRPYVEMTRHVMKAFGVKVDVLGDDRFRVRTPQSYQGTRYLIEPDASAASYFWAAAAITDGQVTVQGLFADSLQGDLAFCECLQQMGCGVSQTSDGTTVRGGTLRGIDVDMCHISDTVQTLAAVALFAEGPTRIRGVAHIRHKETDRIGDLARELRKLGAEVDESSDGLTITPGRLTGAEIATYDDHRMAMSLSLVGLRVDGVVIQDPDCTRKTYPHFFRDLERLGAE